MRAVEEIGIINTGKLAVPEQDNYLSLPLGSIYQFFRIFSN